MAALNHIPAQPGAADTLEHIGRALLLEPKNPHLLLKRAACLLTLGESRQAREAAAVAKASAGPDAKLLDAIGHVLSRAGDQAGALAAYEQAIALAPQEMHFRFNRATVRRYLGDLEGAEADYDRVLALKPVDYEAQLNRSELRTQTPERNHIATLEALIAERRADWRGEVALRYALAKEYEDLGQYERSFSNLARGARLRREHLRYDIEKDVATAECIQKTYTGVSRATGATGAEAAAADAQPGPIFIVGLPRSGSSLVERILGCHSRVRVGGELPQFALALMSAVKSMNGGAPSTREAMVGQSALLDLKALGFDYLARVRAWGVDGECFTDKMPLNYLYCGLIRRALPHARIVHVRRHPMAACYAIYKRLFQDGYPFSYDLTELGRYYVSYRRLMRHWADTLPGAIHELRYEELVADPRGETLRLFKFCGLDWEDSCGDFLNNTAPITTASAVQVRRPLHDEAVAQWRNYGNQLLSLEQQLRAAGFADD
jgi:tetratricopeptide (TPR) repeat protein